VKIALGILAGLLVTAAVAALALRQTTGNAHGTEILYAAAITFISAEASLLPLALARRASPATIFQAGFGGTVLHLLLTLALGAAVHSLNLVDRRIFLFLLLGLYWFSLIFVVTAMSRVFRRAMPQPSAPNAH
jgi:hypothetical protein